MQMESSRVNTRRDRTRLARTDILPPLVSTRGWIPPSGGSASNLSSGSVLSTQQPPIGRHSGPLSTEAHVLSDDQPPSVAGTRLPAEVVRTLPLHFQVPKLLTP